MAHGSNSVLKRAAGACKIEGKTGIGSRRIFPPHFKLQVLDSYRNDDDCKGNQRATARKYGIHRRQIQKWLQVESNLRNSVGKGKSSDCVVNSELALRNVGQHRQRDDVADACSRAVDARVPSPGAYSEKVWCDNAPMATGPVPLDFTTHSRGHASPIAASPVPPCDPAAPMDLSLKRHTPVGDTCAPVYQPPSPHLPLHSAPYIVNSTVDYPSIRQNPDIWDLSIKNQKRKNDESPRSSVSSNTKPVKLFKPYLDDLQDSNHSDDCHVKTEEISSPCCNSYGYSAEPFYHDNNNVYLMKSECTYTLTELQPKNFYPVRSPTYIYQEAEYDHLYYSYDDSFLQSGTPIKQRQSYSLDFKLSAIECYHQDEFCRGNQRAVASKYNVHRRQVQKWLKQENELRQRIETVKQVHIS